MIHTRHDIQAKLKTSLNAQAVYEQTFIDIMSCESGQVTAMKMIGYKASRIDKTQDDTKNG